MRKNRIRNLSTRVALIFLIFSMIFAVTSDIQAITDSGKIPKNIIILFADGVASSQLELARYASQHIRKQPFAITDSLLRKGHLLLMANNTHEAFVTDSAAAGSAMSTGVKTRLGSVATCPEGNPKKSVMECAKEQKKRIGIVSTAAVYDATPASFCVHAKSRAEYSSLVDQYVAMEPDVMLGAGYDYFLPEGQEGGKRKDGKDIIAIFRDKGYEIARNPKELKEVKGSKLLGLFAEEDMNHEIDRDPAHEPSVAEMADAAIRALSQASPNGFVLLVEVENTDKAGHRNDVAALLKDLYVFDQAVQIAMEFQRKAPGETLLIVTGDHETGGLSATYALKDLSSTKSKNRFYTGPQHFAMIERIDISLEKASEILGKKPTEEALDKLVAEHFPGFQLDSDLKSAILKQELLERNFTYATQCGLSRMVSRQTGFYWGTAGHSAQPVLAVAVGPGADTFGTYMDNTEFGKTLHRLIEGQ